MMSPEQEALIGRVFEAYLTEHHHEDILRRVAECHDEGAQHHSVVVNAMTLFEANMEVRLKTHYSVVFGSFNM